MKYIFGTAFAIGNNVFVVAGHSLEAVLKEAQAGISFKDSDGALLIAPLIDHELFATHDIGLVKAKVPQKYKILPWETKKIFALTDVFSIGFPFGQDNSNNALYFRGLKGHIVSELTLFDLAKTSRGYELSFQCPPGLSGAPLIYKCDAGFVVKGIVINNRLTSMETSRNKEVIEEAGKKEITIVERYDSVQYGIAIQTQSVQQIQSRMLRSTIGEHLTQMGLLL